METILELIKYTLPALVVVLVVYLMMKSHFENDYKLKLLQLKADSSKDVIPLKLQAYERLTIFVHRISPENLIPRINQPGMSAQQFKVALIQSIQQEFEHNITQQVYVSNGVWGAVVSFKNTFANIVNVKSKSLKEGDSAYDLGKLIVEEFLNNEELLTASKVNDVIKAEVKSVFI